MSLPQIFAGLSHDTKVVAAAWFGAMRPIISELTFHMVKGRPTAQAQAALDELEAAGLINREARHLDPAVTYVPQVDFGPLLAWSLHLPQAKLPNIRLVEPIAPGAAE